MLGLASSRRHEINRVVGWADRPDEGREALSCARSEEQFLVLCFEQEARVSFFHRASVAKVRSSTVVYGVHMSGTANVLRESGSSISQVI